MKSKDEKVVYQGTMPEGTTGGELDRVLKEVLPPAGQITDINVGTTELNDKDS